MRIRALLALVVLDTALSPWDLAGQRGSPSSVAGRWDVMAESPPATASWPTAGTLTIDQAGDSLRAILEWIPGPTVSLAGSRSQSELLLVGPWTNDMVVDGVRVRARTQLSGTIHPDGSLQGEIALAREDNGRLSFRRAWSARRSAEGEPSSPQTAEHPSTGAPPVAIAAAESLEARFQRALADIVSAQRLVGATASLSIDGHVHLRRRRLGGS